MEDIQYRRAKARVEERLGFYRHATIYMVVNLFLVGLNWVRTPDSWWAIWPAFGWGIGLLAHGLSVYSYRWGGSTKEAMIQREMEREARAKTSPGRRP